MKALIFVRPKIILIFINFIFMSGLIGQTIEKKTKGIEASFIYYQAPAINISFSKDVNWPTKRTTVSNGIEFFELNKNPQFMFTSRISNTIWHTKIGINLNLGISILLFPNFLYNDSENLANFGLKPEFTISYKNFGIGYQLNEFLFKEPAIGFSRESAVLYYRIAIWK